MNKTIILIGIVLVLVVSGCSKQYIPQKIDYTDEITAIPLCNDGVICYAHDSGNTGTGVSCIKDVELTDKYCNPTIIITNK